MFISGRPFSFKNEGSVTSHTSFLQHPEYPDFILRISVENIKQKEVSLRKSGQGLVEH